MPSPPNYPALKLLTLALESLRAGDFPSAESTFQNVLTHDPTNTTALHQLSLLAYNRGDLPTASTYLQKAVDTDPDNLNLLASHGVLLHELGEPRKALDFLLRVLAADPSQPEIWNAAGICFQETRQPASAIEFYLRTLSLQPDFVDAHNNLGVVLTHEGNYGEAIYHLRQALKLRPDFADGHSNLGVALRNRFEYSAAIASFREAYRLDPNSANIAGGLGEVLSLIYHPDAESILRRSVDLRPTDPEKHWNLAAELLKRGDYLNGWQEYEVRWQRPKDQTPLRPFTQPYWRGDPNQNLAGSTLLLHAEQGFGDTLQFLRYVPLLLAHCAALILEVHAPLKSLIDQYARQLSGSVTVIASGDPLPPFDWHIPTLSLPRAFRTTLETIPPPQRFTPPAPTRPASTPNLRIGIAYAGNPHHARDRERSIPLAALQPLFEIPGITWVSLQTGPTAAQLQSLHTAIELPPLPDFLATAAVIDTLDLVISVDSAVAHLAASQGAPTWILLPYVGDWRWLRPTNATTPWYPDARIFRQQTLPSGQPQSELWAPIIADVTAAIRALAIPASGTPSI